MTRHHRNVRRNQLSATVAVIAAAIAAPAFAGTFATITPDGSFSDWASVPIAVSDVSGDGSPIDFADVQIANDDSFLYLRVNYHTPVNPQNNASFANPFLAFDTDSNVATGFDVYGLGAVGSEFGIQNDFPFDQRGGFNSGAVNNGAAAISPVDFANPANLFTSQEYAIPRTGTFASDNAPVFSGNSFKLLIYVVGGSNADTTAAIPYTFARQTVGWALAGSGDWNIASNWTDGTVPNASGAVARLNNGIERNATVYSDGDVTVGKLEFDNSYTYVVAGAGSLTLDVASGSAAIDVLSGNHKVNLPLTLNDDAVATVAAGSTLTIADPLNLNGKTLTTGGAGVVSIISTVSSSAPATVSVGAGTLSAQMDLGSSTSLNVSGGFVEIGATQRIDAVSMSGGTIEVLDAPAPRVLKVNSLAATGTSAIQLNDNPLIVNYAGPSPFAAVDALIASGKITANLPTGSGLALVEASAIGSPAIFFGESVDATSLLARVTLLGDANLDGRVNFDDLLRLAANYNSLSGMTWAQGDSNHDGAVNFDDLLKLAANYNQSVTGSLGDDWALARQAVPEPAALGVAMSAALVLVRRRR